MKLVLSLKTALLFVALFFYVLIKGLIDFFLQWAYFRMGKAGFRTLPSPLSKKLDFVCISHVHWYGNIWQRNHHTMSRLSEKHCVIYCTPKWILQIAKELTLLKGNCGKSGDLRIHSPCLINGEKRIPFIDKINRFIVTNFIKRMIYRKRLAERVYQRDIVLWYYFPFVENIIGNLNETLVVYDIQDDYASFPWAPKDIKEREKRLIERSDLLLTGTNSLFEKNRIYNKNSHFLPCGVDFDHFGKASQISFILPQDIAKMPQPIIGYFGGIDERIDFDLLEYMAKMHPEWSIVMIGPIREWAENLPIEKNIHFLGKKEYHQLPLYLSGFTICMIPFKMNPLSLQSNPTKLLEYLAAGKPVVSTPIYDLKKLYHDIVEIGENKEEFTQVTARLIREPNTEKILRGREMARNRSWEKMVNSIEGLILSSIRQKHGLK